MAAAADKLRLSARPDMGIFTSVTGEPKSVADTPRASFPKIAIAPCGIFTSLIEVDACDESNSGVADGNVVATSVKGMPSITGMFHSDPAVDLTTFGEYISTDSGDVITAEIPIASAERSIVPAFPGSCI